MKYKHTITIADVQINIVTEEEPEVVEAVVGILDRRIREIFVRSDNRCPKIEAALLCALDYCIEKNNLQETISRMEEELRGIDVKALVAELAELKSEKEQLCGQLTYAEEQARTFKNGADIANDQINILKTQVEAAAELAATNDALVAKVAELEAALAEKSAELEAKSAEINTKTEELRAKSDALEAKSEELETVAANLAKAEERIADLESEIDDLEDELDELEDEIDDLEEKLEDFEDEEEEDDEDDIEELEEEPEEDEELEVEIVVEEDTAEEIEEEEEAPETVQVEEVTEELETAESEEKAEEVEKRPVAAIADDIEEDFEMEMKPLRRGSSESVVASEPEKKEEEKPEDKADEGKPTVEQEKQKAHKRVRSMFDLITFDNV